MNTSVKTVLIIVGAIALLGASFYGGIAYQGAKGASRSDALAAGRPAGAGVGGPMANLTEEEQAALGGMTDEERQAFMQEKFGDQMPGGAPAGGARGMGGGLMDGEVIEIADDTVTLKLASGSSQTVYTDDDTLIAKADGAADLAVGSSVLVAATPEADGVTTATLIVVKP